MGVVRETLNVHVPWTLAFARVIGIPYFGPVVPARSRCPSCKHGVLHIYQDPANTGYWSYCEGCQKAGDLVELAASAWGLQPDAALVRLHDLGFPIPEEAITPARLENYLVYHIQYRSRMAALWKGAQKHLIRYPTGRICLLRDRLRLQEASGPEAWREGPGHLLGSLPTAAVEKCFCPKAAGTGGQKPERAYNCNPSARRVFKGKGWDDVLVIPFYDLPERFSGFLFVGRDAKLASGDLVSGRYVTASSAAHVVRPDWPGCRSFCGRDARERSWRWKTPCWRSACRSGISVCLRNRCRCSRGTMAPRHKRPLPPGRSWKGDGSYSGIGA